ncbi:MAG: RNA polymerase sigma factor [Bacteroidetes bacterium]|nr:RNA polymerase sigma factor [Bacteroidota bacterium]
MYREDLILEGCIAGKRNEQGLLYKKFAPTMMGVCLRYSHNREEAEDILQEGFLKVFQNIRTFRKEGSLEGWIKRIMINHALNQFRKNRRNPFLENLEDINETEILDHAELNGSIEPVPEETLISLIQALPQGYRIVFNLYVIEENSHKEIAETLKISENTSKTQLMKARRLLRQKLLKINQMKNTILVHGK